MAVPNLFVKLTVLDWVLLFVLVFSIMVSTGVDVGDDWLQPNNVVATSNTTKINENDFFHRFPPKLLLYFIISLKTFDNRYLLSISFV